MKKLLIFVITYNAQEHVLDTLNRIPSNVWALPNTQTDMLIIDDASKDATFELIQTYAETAPCPIITQKNAQNLGYGGNQKLGYLHAIQNGYDAVILLHGDGQYAPELIEQLSLPVLNGHADVVLGSRMMHRLDALKGGMPLYKFIGNVGLTTAQNLLLGTKLAEFHTGYRVYNPKALAKVPFEKNSNQFVFDTEILIQMIDTKARILELPIPTFYGSEISHVKVISYGLSVLWATFSSRFQNFSWCKKPQYTYAPKKGAKAET